MATFDLDVGGNAFITQKGTKIELGTASDHIVIHVDSHDEEQAYETINRSLRLFNYAKMVKTGQLPVPARPSS